MKRSLLAMVAVLTLILAALPAGASGPEADLAPLHRATGEAVPDSYIVVLEEGVHAAEVASSVAVSPEFVYEHAISGFAARLDERELERLRRHPQVAYLEEDQVATVESFVQHDAPWNLDRIDQIDLPLDTLYHWSVNAALVDAYVVDTGIDTSNPEFTHRAEVLGDVLGGDGQDCNGHGSAVAGIVGALTYGVAKTVKLWGVRALGCGGSGSYASIIAATDLVRQHHATTGTPGVAVYSLVGGYSSILNQAVTNLVNAGVFVVAAAGNFGANACNYSPASAAGVMTVGATAGNDQRTSWTNYGACVEIYAPGVSVTSVGLAWGTLTFSGTSASAPHVAGVGALFLAGVPGKSPFPWVVNNAIWLVDSRGPFPLLHKAGL